VGVSDMTVLMSLNLFVRRPQLAKVSESKAMRNVNTGCSLVQ